MGAEFGLLMTPGDKAKHVAANFGTGSLLARAWELIASQVGDHPTEDKLNAAITEAEKFVEEEKLKKAALKPQ